MHHLHMLSWSTCSWCKHLDASNGHGLIVSMLQKMGCSLCHVSHVACLIQNSQVKVQTNIQWPKTDMLVILEEFQWLFYSDIQLFPEFTTVELVLNSMQDVRPSRDIVVQIMIFMHVTHLLTLQKKKDIFVCHHPPFWCGSVWDTWLQTAIKHKTKSLYKYT